MKPVLTAPLLIVTSIGDTVMRHILSATLLAMTYQRKARKDQYSNTTVKTTKLSNKTVKYSYITVR